MSVRLRIEWDEIRYNRNAIRAKGLLAGVPRTALQRLAPLIKQRAIELSPFKTGKFASQWYYRTQSGPALLGDGHSVLELGNRHDQADAILFGSPPHLIFPRAKRVLRFETGDGVVFSKRVSHPGTEGTNVFVLLEEDSFIQNRISTTFSNILNEVTRKL